MNATEPAPDGAYRPRIGLTTYFQRASWGVWDGTAAIVPASYVHRVVEAGGTPLLLPPLGTDPSVVDLLDGLIVIGGVDVDPAGYGQDPHPTTASQPERDRHDVALTHAAIDAALPLFAICRGMQVLNVAYGGSLHQHLPEIVADAQQRYQPAPGRFGTVDFAVADGTLSSQLLGPAASSPCYHHQSLDRVAEPLAVTATAADGTVEMVEMPEAEGWVIGTQFHPEENAEDLRLFTGFVDAARSYAERRGRTHARGTETPDVMEDTPA